MRKLASTDKIRILEAGDRHAPFVPDLDAYQQWREQIRSGARSPFHINTGILQTSLDRKRLFIMDLNSVCYLTGHGSPAEDECADVV